MTRKLILVRHSKAQNRQSSVNDFERSLTEEGKDDSRKMAEFLKKEGIRPDVLVTSSAARAFETATILAEVFGTEEKNILTSRKLYYCSAKTILDQIYGLRESLSCVMIVAHNPGISDLTRGLSAGKFFFMDNTQVTVLEFDMEQWHQVDVIKPAKFKSYTLKDVN
jgi:phosphohistidine phosphatase